MLSRGGGWRGVKECCSVPPPPISINRALAYPFTHLHYTTHSPSFVLSSLPCFVQSTGCITHRHYYDRCYIYQWLPILGPLLFLNVPCEPCLPLAIVLADLLPCSLLHSPSILHPPTPYLANGPCQSAGGGGREVGGRGESQPRISNSPIHHW